MGKYCTEASCREEHTKDSPYSFHRFPIEPKRRQQWAVKVNRETRNEKGNRVQWQPADHDVLCSKHFLDSSFTNRTIFSKKMNLPYKPQLREDAVPTIFMHSNAKRKKEEEYAAKRSAVAEKKWKTETNKIRLKMEDSEESDKVKLSQIPEQIIKIEVANCESFPDCDHLHKKEYDFSQMSADNSPGVNISNDERVNNLKSISNKLEENSKNWSDTGALHSQNSSLNEKSRCELCGADFAQASSLKVHMSVYHGQDLQALLPHDSSFTGKSVSGINHNYNNTIAYFKCINCQKAFKLFDELDRHQSICTDDRPIKCNLCGKAFSDFSSLKRHHRIHTGDKPFKCIDCGKAFSDPSSLKRHERIHTGDKPFKSTDCAIAFTDSSALKRHKHVHTGDKPFKCSDCGKFFRYISSLKTHQHIHTGDKPFKCTDCGKAFSQSGPLKTHQRTHTGYKPLMCTDCGKAFSNSSHLKKHQNIHDKPFKCTDCGKAFNYSDSLKNHQRIHTVYKPFKCTYCDKTFIKKSHLKVHEYIHTGDKPLKCTICGKAFYHSGSFKIHQRIHTGEKPFKCTDCGKSFSEKTNLNAHLVIHTGDKIVQVF